MDGNGWEGVGGGGGGDGGWRVEGNSAASLGEEMVPRDEKEHARCAWSTRQKVLQQTTTHLLGLQICNTLVTGPMGAHPLAAAAPMLEPSSPVVAVVDRASADWPVHCVLLLPVAIIACVAGLVIAFARD